jgi:hypothetical protein
MRWRTSAVLATVVINLGCSPSTPGPVPSTLDPTSAPLLEDVSADAGLDFVHWNGMTGALYFVEPVGAGGGVADLDGDGDLDLIVIQGNLLQRDGAASDAEPLHPPPSRPGSRIFRNDLRVDDRGQPKIALEDVTDDAGLVADGYGMGVATGDFDNDGLIDVYLTCFGHNQLWHNVSTDGRIRFEDVTVAAGVDDPRWSTSASFVDVDRDGWLDLFVANYVDFRLATHRPCRSPGGRPDYCGPQSYHGETDRLFRNRGNGTFEDVSGSAGLLGEASSGLGVVAADLDRDGWSDLYVANDLRRNFLWRNLGLRDGGFPRFSEIALVSGAAVSMDGRAQASMGLAAGDLDNDGDDDLFMTHLSADTNTLYVNDGHAVFTDRSAASGLGGSSLAETGFGTALIDVDNDGLLDVAVANGAVKVIEAQARAGDPYPLKQPNQLFRNRGDGTVADISESGGSAFTGLEVSRGLAIGDVDNDGHSDILITNNNGPARLVRGIGGQRSSWVGLRVLTGPDGRDAIGARLAITRPDGTVLYRRVATDGSYLSASDPRILVGLGAGVPTVSVRVEWATGGSHEWTGLVTGRYHTLAAGGGDGREHP